MWQELRKNRLKKRIMQKVRIVNKQFWFALVPALLLVIRAGTAIFGYTLGFGDLGNKILAFIDAILLLWYC